MVMPETSRDFLLIFERGILFQRSSTCAIGKLSSTVSSSYILKLCPAFQYDIITRFIRKVKISLKSTQEIIKQSDNKTCEIR